SAPRGSPRPGRGWSGARPASSGGSPSAPRRAPARASRGPRRRAAPPCAPATGRGSRRPSSVDPLPLPLPPPIPPPQLLALPGGLLRTVSHLPRRRRLEARDVLLAELDDLPLARGLSGLEGHEGLGPLAPLLVRDGHHRALHHRGVPGHALLDLDRGDVLAA